MKLHIKTARGDTFEFEYGGVLDYNTLKQVLELASEQWSKLYEATITKVGETEWFRMGNTVKVTDGEKQLTEGYLDFDSDSQKFWLKEDWSKVSLLRLYRMKSYWFKDELLKRSGWRDLTWAVTKIYRVYVRFPAVTLWKAFSGIPWWLKRWLQEEPECPFCRGSGISYGDHLDMFAEYPCHQCGGQKKLRKCSCNPFGLYPIWGKRFRVRENCPAHCGDYKLPNYAERGWVRIEGRVK